MSKQKTVDFSNSAALTTLRSRFEIPRSFLPMVVWRMDGNWACRATPRKTPQPSRYPHSKCEKRKADVVNSDSNKRNHSYMTPLRCSCLLPGHSFLWQRCKVGRGLKDGVQVIEQNQFAWKITETSGMKWLSLILASVSLKPVYRHWDLDRVSCSVWADLWILIWKR